VVDDLVVWWSEPARFDVVANAANTAAVQEVLAAEARRVDDVTVDDVTAGRALVAVQGPDARSRLATVSPDAAAVGHFRVAPVTWRGHRCQVAGTGYTGEDGVEWSVPAGAAAEAWEALVGAGVGPAGLGARDTLRLEAGLPLHGHELGPGITPLQAGLAWVVGWDKGPFRGRAALEAEQARGPHRRMRGLALDSRRPPRPGCPVLVDGRPVGQVTSGNFSPTLRRGIALAFLPPEISVGARVVVEVRGRGLDAYVVRLPFVTAGRVATRR
jgi:aminomethyltransferase